VLPRCSETEKTERERKSVCRQVNLTGGFSFGKCSKKGHGKKTRKPPVKQRAIRGGRKRGEKKRKECNKAFQILRAITVSKMSLGRKGDMGTLEGEILTEAGAGIERKTSKLSQRSYPSIAQIPPRNAKVDATRRGEN